MLRNVLSRYRPRLGKTAKTHRRAFNKKTVFSNDVVTLASPYQITTNAMGMPIPTPTKILHRLREHSLFTKRSSILFGETSRQAIITPPAQEITFGHVQKHSIQEQDPNNFFVSLSGQKEVSERFKKRLSPNATPVMLHVDASEHHPYTFADTDSTLAAQSDDFAAEDNHRENEFLVRNLLAFSIKHLEQENVTIDYPFHIQPTADIKDQYEEYCRHYDYTIYYVSQLDPANDRDKIEQLLQGMLQQMLALCNRVFGKGNNPFNMTVAQFSKQYPDFINSSTVNDQALRNQSVVEKGMAFFKSNADAKLGEVYQKSLFDCYLEYPYLKPTAPKLT